MKGLFSISSIRSDILSGVFFKIILGPCCNIKIFLVIIFSEVLLSCIIFCVSQVLLSSKWLPINWARLIIFICEKLICKKFLRGKSFRLPTGRDSFVIGSSLKGTYALLESFEEVILAIRRGKIIGPDHGFYIVLLSNYNS